MKIEPATRRANFWLFLGLVVFAFALCALVLLWMRARTRAQGGRVYPPASASFFCHPGRSAAGTQSKDLASYYSRPFAFRPARGEDWTCTSGEVLRLRCAPLRMTEV